MSYGTRDPLYNQFTVKPGDVLTSPSGTTAFPTMFASGYTVPANAMTVGGIVVVDFPVVYQLPTVAVSSTTLSVCLGGKVVYQSPAFSNLVGTSAQPIAVRCIMTVTGVGASGSVSTWGYLTYAIAGSVAVMVPIAPTSTAVNTTVANFLGAGVSASVSGAIFTLGPGMTINQRPPVAASN